MATPSGGRRGRFITFEGGEGSGKSTQIRMLAEHLDKVGIRTVVTREPGGSPGAEIVRHLLLSGVGKALGAECETLLFAAARDDHVSQVIAPALDSGQWVLCDRFTDSTRVYQGRLGQVDIHLIRAMERVTIGTLRPDLTLVLDVPVEVGLARAAQRRGAAPADRFEAENAEFHRRLRQAYREITDEEPDRCRLIWADAPPDAVASTIWSTIATQFTDTRELKKLEVGRA
jgi:dTMP kinase